MEMFSSKPKAPKNCFKDAHSLEDRISSYRKIIKKNPDRIPIIVVSPEDICLDKHKYLVPYDITVGQFMHVLRKRIGNNLSAEQALFLFVNNALPPVQSLVSEIYRESKDEDGYLYMTLMKESTYG
jgi:GABA(A) receptor-associated protein